MVVWIPDWMQTWAEEADEGLVMFAGVISVFRDVYSGDRWLEFKHADISTLSLTPRQQESKVWIRTIPGIQTAQILNNELLVRLTDPATGKIPHGSLMTRCVPYQLKSQEAISIFSYFLGRMASIVRQIDDELLDRIQEIKKGPPVRAGVYHRYKTQKIKVASVPNIYITQYNDYRPWVEKQPDWDDK